MTHEERREIEGRIDDILHRRSQNLQHDAIFLAQAYMKLAASEIALTNEYTTCRARVTELETDRTALARAIETIVAASDRDAAITAALVTARALK